MRGRSTNSRARVYLPNVLHGDPFIRRNDDYTNINVDGSKRVGFSNVLKMMALFTRQQIRRAELSHDCAVFALACDTDQTLADTHFYKQSKRKVGIGKAELLTPPRTNEGPHHQIIFSATHGDPRIPNDVTNPHFMVKATADENPPLYASKVGINGGVILSTVEEAAKIYPANSYWEVSDLYLKIDAFMTSDDR